MDAMMIIRAVRLAGPIGMTAMLLTLPACGNPLEALGAKIPPPDEFQVIATKPLVMPATAALPDPRPGAPSPLDPDPHREAVQALLGTSASPVESTSPPSAGEQVLLSSANAAAASSTIRVQLEEDKIQGEADKPYQPPTVGELFTGKKSEKLDESELLDPVAESQRLQREGYITPVDPNATVEVDEERPQDDQYRPSRPYRQGGPITVEGTGPAY
jgi:hypothetical protein